MASLEAGRRLAGRYLLIERLGDGGHAEVWAAEDGQSGQRVALKFLHPGACSVDEALLVLRHEARMARFLDHPGVLRVEAPLRDGEVAFLPMEHAPGGNAAQLRGESWRRIVPVLIQVARVLEHAHARGIVHRDIKPGNVLFAADGSVRVADFGTSTQTGSRDAPATGSPAGPAACPRAGWRTRGASTLRSPPAKAQCAGRWAGNSARRRSGGEGIQERERKRGPFPATMRAPGARRGAAARLTAGIVRADACGP